MLIWFDRTAGEDGVPSLYQSTKRFNDHTKIFYVKFFVRISWLSTQVPIHQFIIGGWFFAQATRSIGDGWAVRSPSFDEEWRWMTVK